MIIFHRGLTANGDIVFAVRARPRQYYVNESTGETSWDKPGSDEYKTKKLMAESAHDRSCSMCCELLGKARKILQNAPKVNPGCEF